MKTTSIIGAVALGAIATAMACTFSTSPESTAGDAGIQGRDHANKGSDDAGGGASVAPPTDGDELATFSPTEVISIVEALHLGEVAQGQLAVDQAVSQDVKAFAQHMVTDHQKGAQKIAKLLGTPVRAETPQIRLQRDPTAAIIMQQGELVTNDLKTKTGPAFDLAYMTTQVTDHAKVLALIDHALLPSALQPQPQNAVATGQSSQSGSSNIVVNATDLQENLRASRVEVAEHLVSALEIQRALRTAPTQGATPPPGPGSAPPPEATPPPGATPPPPAPGTTPPP